MVNNPDKDKEFRLGRVLMDWYQEHGRELPWRETKDPYLIWISEVILQQTRVAQGLDYFRRFVGRFPDVLSLAEAEEDEVLKYWQGLGYYSRARNLHTAARDIRDRFGGKFPDDYTAVLSLKGIGEYTAAAVCSFAWNQPYAVVDGNVYRVLSRVLGINIPIDSPGGKKYFAELAKQLLSVNQPALYNQAIMDFGAVQCVPKSPACLFCPLRDCCVAFASGQVGRLPVKAGKTVIKPRYFNYFHVRYGKDTLIAQRTAKDIWQNLYEFPLIETEREMELESLALLPDFKRLFEDTGEIRLIRRTETFKHVLSHRIIYARFYEIKVEKLSSALQQYRIIPETAFENYAVSRLISLYWEGREKCEK